MTPIAIFLDIRSTENVGAMFRTADAAGISKIYLAGYTASPTDRFGRPRKDIAKSALGAEKNVAWESVPKVLPLLQTLKKEGYAIVAIEQNKNSIDYKKLNKKLARKVKITFLVGNEVTGIPDNILKHADIIAEIQMKGGKESLNVATAFGIALFRILDI